MRKLPHWILLAVLIGTVFSCPARAITLPIEVMRSTAGSRLENFQLPSGAAAQVTTLQMRLQGVEYDGEASVQLNGAPAVVLTRANTRPVGVASEWGGIGGPANVFTLQLPVSAGALVDGKNQITFRYLRTDGVNSGYRVIGLALLDAAGNKELPASQIVWEDPSTWTAPQVNGKPATADDVKAGWLTYTTTSLITSPLNAMGLHVRCADCHTADGRDLAYFNYSNRSIISRSMFHGLSLTQGQQIAAYIRSLPYRSQNGRPWNPPYQPGPGLDSRPASEWAAGAGIDAVLSNDQAVLPYLFPNGINKDTIATTANLNLRELPQAFPLPTWNQWLPSVHPLDAPWGARFATDPFFTDYEDLDNALKAASADPAAFTSFLTTNNAGGLHSRLFHWIFVDGLNFDKYLRANFLDPLTNNPTPAISEAGYSTARWRLVKEFEINQTYNLETQGATYYGSMSDAAVVPSRLIEPRTWFTQVPFNTSPHAIGLPLDQDAHALHGSLFFTSYFLVAWYRVQMVVNAGNGRVSNESPFDYGYSFGSFAHESFDTSQPIAGWDTAVMVKGAQESQNGRALSANGYDPNLIFNLGVLSTPLSGTTAHLWDGYDPATRSALLNALYGAWLDGANLHTLQEYQAAGMASPTTLIDPKISSSSSMDQKFGGRVYQSLQRGAASGVDGSLLSQMNAWAITTWPDSTPTFQNLMNSLGLGISITPLLGNSQ